MLFINIKFVSEKTGLTKKAIKYYESEGLIIPWKNNYNNYREYTDQDVIRLNLIGALRCIDISISEIKCLLDGNKDLKNIMMDTLNKINESISSLQKSSLVISTIMSKNLQNYSAIGEQVKKLRETLEFSVGEKKGFISATLLRIFPGNFGKLVVIIYEPFLDICINSDEKKEVWLKLVTYLDDLNEVNENHPAIKNIINMDTTQTEMEFKRGLKHDTLKILNGDIISLKEKRLETTILLYNSLNENEELRKKMSESMVQSRYMLNDIGATTNTFEEYLEILNEDYKRYKEVELEINNAVDEEMRKKFGVTLKEFFQNAGNTHKYV